MKKKISFAISIAAIIAIATSFALTGCANTDDSSTVGTAYAREIGLSAISSGTILADLNSDPALSLSEERATETSDTVTSNSETAEVPDAGSSQGEADVGDSLSEEETETVDHYLSIVDKLLNDSAFTVTERASELEGYSYQIVIGATDIYGNAFSFVIDYNEKTVETDGDETESVIEGVMNFNGTDYAVLGERETESDESELEFTAYIDGENYVEIQQSRETGEEEFSYKVVKDGQVVEEFELEIEQSGRKTEIEIESFVNGQRLVIDFETRESASGNKVIDCKVVSGDCVTECSIHAAKEGNREMRRYRYRNGSCRDMYDD